VVLAMLAACDGGGGETPSAGSPTPVLSVVTTIYPVTYFAERTGGERVEVLSLVRPGVEAHDFEPTPGDIRAINTADVLVYVDPAFETWVPDTVRSAGSGLLVVETGDLSDVDPHVWLNPVQAADQARRIATALSTADPAGADFYSASSGALIAELLLLDSEFAEALSSCALGHMVVSHEAYGHLEDRYGVEQIGLAALSAEFESTPQRIADVIREMERLGVSHILQEPLLSDDLAKTVAAETGAELLTLHPLESLTQAEADGGDTYFTVMRRNLESLVTALHCG
jgi:zinc transport system substrate-binding protein